MADDEGAYFGGRHKVKGQRTDLQQYQNKIRFMGSDTLADWPAVLGAAGTGLKKGITSNTADELAGAYEVGRRAYPGPEIVRKFEELYPLAGVIGTVPRTIMGATRTALNPDDPKTQGHYEYGKLREQAAQARSTRGHEVAEMGGNMAGAIAQFAALAGIAPAAAATFLRSIGLMGAQGAAAGIGGGEGLPGRAVGGAMGLVEGAGLGALSQPRRLTGQIQKAFGQGKISPEALEAAAERILARAEGRPEPAETGPSKADFPEIGGDLEFAPDVRRY